MSEDIPKRVTVPTFEIASNPTVFIQDIKNRRLTTYNAAPEDFLEWEEIDNRIQEQRELQVY